ncbi:MAG: serine hydrolase [Pseudomonadota bacterium]
MIGQSLALCVPAVSVARDSSFAPRVLPDGWPVGTPEQTGFKREALINLVELMSNGPNFPNVHALLIEYRGRLVFEHYWPGEDGEYGFVQHGPETLHDLRSITKSVISLLLGKALEFADPSLLDQPVANFFPQFAAGTSASHDFTLHDALTMTAGLEWNETIVPYDVRNDFVQMLTSSDPLRLLFEKPQIDQAGQVWRYNSGLTELVAGIIERLTQRPLVEYAKDVLFRRLGIEHYEWWRPPEWPTDMFPSASAGLRLRARDLAKIGALLLGNGSWKNHEIIPSRWIGLATSTHVGRALNNYGYGYFWITGRHAGKHRLVMAAGHGDQRLFVLPDLGLAVTLFAGNYDRGSLDIGDRVLGRILRARS